MKKYIFKNTIYFLALLVFVLTTNLSNTLLSLKDQYIHSNSPLELTPTVLAQTTGKTVVLNPGHAVNPSDPELGGAPGEAEKNIELAKKVQAKLTTQGVNAFITHDENSTFNTNNRYDDFQQRIDFSNDYNNKNPAGNRADLFVEIHFDSAVDNPYAFYADRKILVDSSVDGSGVSRPNPNIITPNVDQWIEQSIKAGELITKHLAIKLNQKYNRGFTETGDVRADHGCIGRACGGHLFVLGPEGTLSDPERPESTILRENQAYSTYIEVLSNTDPNTGDLDLLADGLVAGILEFLGLAPALPGNSEFIENSYCPINGGFTGSTYFCQNDPKWNQATTPGASCSLAEGGCGPTTAAMLMARFGDVAFPSQTGWGTYNKQSVNITSAAGKDLRGQAMNPTNLDHLFVGLDWRSCGTDHMIDGFLEWLTTIDYTVAHIASDSTPNIGEISQAISDGYLLIGSVYKYPLRDGGSVGHIFGISGVDLSRNKLTLFDPAGCSDDTRGDTVEDFSIVSSWGWHYVYKVKKKDVIIPQKQI